MAAALTLLAQVTTTTEAPSGISLVLPDLNELIAGIIAFLIVFGFIWFKGRHWIDRLLTARRQAIAGKLAEADQAKVEADKLLADYHRQLAGARDEANSIVEEGRRSAEAVRAEIMTKARSEAQELAQRNREGMAAERERAAQQMRDLVAVLSLELAEKVVGATVDEKAQAELVNRYIDDLPGLAK